MSSGDLLVVTLVAGVASLAFWGARRDARCGCGGCCATCRQMGRCHQQADNAGLRSS